MPFDEDAFLSQLLASAQASLGQEPTGKSAFVPAPGLAQAMQQAAGGGVPPGQPGAPPPGGPPGAPPGAPPGGPPGAPPQPDPAAQAPPGQDPTAIAAAGDPNAAPPPPDPTQGALTPDSVRAIIREEMNAPKPGAGGGGKGGAGKVDPEMIKHMATDAFNTKQMLMKILSHMGIDHEMVDPHRDPNTGLPTDQAAQGGQQPPAGGQPPAPPQLQPGAAPAGPPKMARQLPVPPWELPPVAPWDMDPMGVGVAAVEAPKAAADDIGSRLAAAMGYIK